MMCSPDLPVVLMNAGISTCSQTFRIVFARVMTCSNGASFGSRSIRQQPGRHRAVELDEIAFRVLLLGPEDLVEVGELDVAELGARSLESGRYFRLRISGS